MITSQYVLVGASVHVYDIDGTLIRTIASSQRPFAAGFVEWDRLVVFCEQEVSMWELEDGSHLGTIDTYRLNRAAVDPRSRFVALAGDNEITIRSIDLTHDIAKVRHGGSYTELTDVAFHPQHELLATAGDNAKVSIWTVRSGEEVLRLEQSNVVRCISWSTDMLAIGETDGSVSLVSVDDWSN